MSEFNYLENLEGAYGSAAAATGGKLPDGRYTAILNEARLLDPSDQHPTPRFSASFVVTEGEYKGRFLYISFNFNEKGFPYFKAFCQTIGLELPRLMELPDKLPDFSGNICQLTLVEQKNDPRYQNTYVDRYIGTGSVADYLKPKPVAGGEDFQEVADDDGDIPF